MRKANIRQAAHGQADEGDEAESAHHQEGEDVHIEVPHKEFRSKAGESEEDGGGDGGAQHFGDIGAAAHAAYGIEVGFEDFMTHPFGRFFRFLFNGFVVRKHFGFFTVHKGDGNHLFPLARFRDEDGGDGVCKNSHACRVFSLSFRFGEGFDEIISFPRRQFHVNSGGFLITDAHADDGYFFP